MEINCLHKKNPEQHNWHGCKEYSSTGIGDKWCSVVCNVDTLWGTTSIHSLYGLQGHRNMAMLCKIVSGFAGKHSSLGDIVSVYHVNSCHWILFVAFFHGFFSSNFADNDEILWDFVCFCCIWL